MSEGELLVSVVQALQTFCCVCNEWCYRGKKCKGNTCKLISEEMICSYYTQAHHFLFLQLQLFKLRQITTILQRQKEFFSTGPQGTKSRFQSCLQQAFSSQVTLQASLVLVCLSQTQRLMFYLLMTNLVSQIQKIFKVAFVACLYQSEHTEYMITTHPIVPTKLSSSHPCEG